MKTILITGASKGIGEGLLKAYIEKGMQVYNFDIQEPTFTHPHAHYINCDLSNKEDIISGFSSLPTIDILICNAATFDQGLFLNQSIDDISRIVDVNLLSAVTLSQLYAKQCKNEHGRIVLMSSSRAYMSEANTIGYSISKGGLNALVHSLAITLQEHHITVNGIAPGWINSHNEDIRTIDHQFHPSKRVGIVEDIVRICLFLTDEDASFINGEIVTIDGGVTKKMIYPNV